MVKFDLHCAVCKSQQLTQPPLALSVPLSRFTPRVGGGSAFFVRLLRTMKHLSVILAFLAGVVVTSAVLGYYLVTTQIEMAATDVSMDDEQAMISERILSYIGRPEPTMERLLIFSASNHIAYFPHDVEYWDKRYPYIQIKRRSASMIEGFQIFLQTNSVLHTSQSQPNKIR
jgi:hypothetical protein